MTMMIDGFDGDLFSIKLSDGKNTHYYDLMAKDKNYAEQLARKWFTEEYNTEPTEVEFGVGGMPVTRNY